MTLGGDSDSLYTPFNDLLHTLAKDDTKVGLIRSEVPHSVRYTLAHATLQALDALTAIAFVTNAHIEPLMEFCHTFKHSAITEAALRNWGVLATMRDIDEHEKLYATYALTLLHTRSNPRADFAQDHA